MPLFLKSGQNWQKRQHAAYYIPASFGLNDILRLAPPQSAQEQEFAPLSTTPDPPTAMERCLQKPPPGMPNDTQDIGALLKRQTPHKMVAQGELEVSADHHRPNVPQVQPLTQGPEQTAPGFPDLSALVIKQDIQNLLYDFKQMLTANIVKIHAGVQMVTDRVRTTEEDILDT
ncbi:Hypothetical predicted protein, partial [Pelobates cultripes]